MDSGESISAVYAVLDSGESILALYAVLDSGASISALSRTRRSVSNFCDHHKLETFLETMKA